MSMNSLISRDGTKIGYEQSGQGPGVVLVQGALGTTVNYRELAAALSRQFTVFIPDRRGRGMSPRTYNADHSIQRDVEDLDSLLSHCGAHFVFGLSSGAVIALEASRTLPAIRKVALYEPPFQLQGMSTELIDRFNREVGPRPLGRRTGHRHGFGQAGPTAATTRSPTAARILRGTSA